MKFTVKGSEKLEERLRLMNSIRWDGVVNKSLTQMFNRGARPPGTPVGKQTKNHSAGELRRSRRKQEISSKDGSYTGSFYYTKDYAPHVEYGHRIVRKGKQVGYVNGKKYLFNNVQKQRQIYFKDMLNELTKKR